jgi:hypothetical protein
MIVGALQRVAKILADSVYSSGILLFVTTACGVGQEESGLVPPLVMTPNSLYFYYIYFLVSFHLLIPFKSSKLMIYGSFIRSYNRFGGVRVWI